MRANVLGGFVTMALAALFPASAWAADVWESQGHGDGAFAGVYVQSDDGCSYENVWAFGGERLILDGRDHYSEGAVELGYSVGDGCRGTYSFGYFACGSWAGP